jgi:hypothetical protein
MKTSILSFALLFFTTIIIGYAGNGMPLNKLETNYFEKVTTYTSENHITILWETTNQPQDFHFVVLVSIDNIQFIPVNQIKGNTKSGEKKTYSFTYNPDMTATYYFKIQAIEESGEVTESKVIAYEYAIPTQHEVVETITPPINNEISFNIPF